MSVHIASCVNWGGGGNSQVPHLSAAHCGEPRVVKKIQHMTAACMWYSTRCSSNLHESAIIVQEISGFIIGDYTG